MMKKVSFAVLGMGNRGTVYAGMQLRYPEEMEVTTMPTAMSFAAEQSRCCDGQVVDMAEFRHQIGVR